MKPVVTAVIPARLGSERFAGKVLHPYRGKPLLFYVWSAVNRSRQIDRLVIATDSERIANEAVDFGAEVIKTSKKHRTGSDRTAEAAAKIVGEIILNVQAVFIRQNWTPQKISVSVFSILRARKEFIHSKILVQDSLQNTVQPCSETN